MPNIKLVLEYDGSGFSGWQVQPDVRTIQGELHRVLELVTRQKIGHIQGAGRTDAGVHAKGQVANFLIDEPIDLERLRHAVSSLLKNEVSVLHAEYVPESFNAMRDAVRKQYTYSIYYSPSPPVLDYGRVWHIAGPLDVERMAEEAKLFIGTHDFTSFRGSGCGARSPIKQIESSEIIVEPPYLYFRVIGRGFLKQMVRNMIGTLVAIGRGRYGDNSIRDILEWRDRRKAADTAQPFGLCMDWVSYDLNKKSV